MTQSLDRISISGLRAYCVLGVHEWERLVQREVRVNLHLFVDTSRAARTDNVADTVDYGGISDRVIASVTGSQFRLVESLAEYVAKVCLENTGVLGVEVRVQKVGALTEANEVAVEITRMRNPA